MKKRVLSILLTLCLLLTLLPAAAAAADTTESGTCGNLRYTIDRDGLLTITGSGEIPRSAFRYYDFQSVVIKEGVTGIGAYAFAECVSLQSVTSPNSLVFIDAYAFTGCESLTSVTIPSTAREINVGTFEGCSSLTSITLPDSLREINNAAFRGCTSLTGITIPNAVHTIKMSAFEECSALTSVTLPDSLTVLGDGAFVDCAALTALLVSDKNTAFSSIDGVLYNKNGSTLLAYPAGKPEDTFTVPEGVTCIDKNAFIGCTNLKYITMSNSVEEVGFYSFQNCTSLETIVLSDRLPGIQSLAIYGCEKLTDIQVSSQNPFLSSRDGILYDKQGTTLLLYPSGKSNASFTIPDGVHTIGYAAFAQCEKIKSVTVPDGVREIEDLAFCGCCALKEITLPRSLSVIRYGLFGYCDKLKSITIPDGVHTIESSAFMWCGSLANVTIPDSVTTIDETAFTECKNVVLICSPGSCAAQYAKGITAKQRNPNQSRFDDVTQNAWYASYVDYVYRSGLMNGISDYLFKPNRPVTRGQLVTILYRMEGEPRIPSYSSFYDVPKGEQYTDAVEWATFIDIVYGVGDGKFNLNEQITREQLATILYRYAGSPAVRGSLSGFPDAGNVSDWAKNAMRWAVSQGIILGVKSAHGTTLSPQSYATRAQIAAIIQRYEELPAEE